MQAFIESIEQSLESKNWFGALFIALALPDVCSTTEVDSPKSDQGNRYKKWFNRYLKSSYEPESLFDALKAASPEKAKKLSPQATKQLQGQKTNPSTHFTAEDCYHARCKCLHEGYLKKKSGETFIFITPPPRGTVVHLNSDSHGQLQMQIDVFCKDVCEAVRKWEQDVKGRPEIQDRLKELLEINPYTSLEPFIKITE